jgi:DNA excision repair protein ERCC-2
VPPEREVQLDKAFFLALRDELDELMVAYHIQLGAERRKAVGSGEDPLVDFHRLYARFASVLELEGDEWSYLFRKGGAAGGALKVLCKDPSRQLGRRIRACAGTVAVSATLEPLEFYRDVLGFPRDETELRAFPSPFPRERRRVLVLDRPSTHYQNRDRDLPIVEDAIRAVVAARSGNYLVAFPSFEYLEMLAPRLLDLPGFEVVKQKKSMSDPERAQVLARLAQFRGPGREGPPPVLLLAVQGGVFTEGIDLPGEMCIGAIVVGPGLPRLSFERELVKAHFDRVYGRGFEYAYLFPGMSRVIQAAGRVIRTATDVGVVALVGDRFAQERYTALFPRDWYVKRPRELVTDDPYGELRRFWAASTS